MKYTSKSGWKSHNFQCRKNTELKTYYWFHWISLWSLFGHFISISNFPFCFFGFFLYILHDFYKMLPMTAHYVHSIYSKVFVTNVHGFLTDLNQIALCALLDYPFIGKPTAKFCSQRPRASENARRNNSLRSVFTRTNGFNS